jgi:5-methylcytosine-specific restriction endonuclease McrA
MPRDSVWPKTIFFGESKNKKRTLGIRDKQILYRRAKGRCEGCGKKIEFDEMQVGHVKAYSKGGATTLANSACLCYRCNKLQGTDTLETLKKKLNGTYGKKSKEKSIKKKIKTKRKQDNPFEIKFTNIKF